MSTPEQCNYLLILFSDLGFSRDARNVFLSDSLRRQIKYLDELTVAEASRFISELKGRKDSNPDDYRQAGDQ